MKSSTRIRKSFKMIAIILLSAFLIGVLFVNLHPTFGGSSNKESLERMMDSTNFNGKKFVNILPTRVMMSTKDVEKYNTTTKGSRKPQTILPSTKVDEKNIINDSITWLGHSTILLKTSNTTIIVDPVFNSASPIPIFLKPFKTENPTTAEDLPRIDVVLITHDHYDHLEYKTIKKLGNKVNKYIVPLGVKAHLLRWGIDSDRIEEKDWYEKTNYKKINITLTPSRHFSGRGLNNRGSTLWGGWIIKSPSQNIFLSGDGGYTDEFKKIGEKYGPFDIAMIENGQYNTRWRQIHMMPEESVQASKDVKARIVLPVHWGKFSLAPHNWDEPITRFMKEAEDKNITVATPMIGETFTLKDIPKEEWWR